MRVNRLLATTACFKMLQLITQMHSYQITPTLFSGKVVNILLRNVNLKLVFDTDIPEIDINSIGYLHDFLQIF